MLGVVTLLFPERNKPFPLSVIPNVPPVGDAPFLFPDRGRQRSSLPSETSGLFFLSLALDWSPRKPLSFPPVGEAVGSFPLFPPDCIQIICKVTDPSFFFYPDAGGERPLSPFSSQPPRPFFFFPGRMAGPSPFPNKTFFFSGGGHVFSFFWCEGFFPFNPTALRPPYRPQMRFFSCPLGSFPSSGNGGKKSFFFFLDDEEDSLPFPVAQNQVSPLSFFSPKRCSPFSPITFEFRALSADPAGPFREICPFFLFLVPSFFLSESGRERSLFFPHIVKRLFLLAVLFLSSFLWRTCE